MCPVDQIFIVTFVQWRMVVTIADDLPRFVLFMMIKNTCLDADDDDNLTMPLDRDAADNVNDLSIAAVEEGARGLAMYATVCQRNGWEEIHHLHDHHYHLHQSSSSGWFQLLSRILVEEATTLL